MSFAHYQLPRIVLLLGSHSIGNKYAVIIYGIFDYRESCANFMCMFFDG